MNQFSTIKQKQNSSNKLMKLKFLLENSNVNDNTLLLNKEKTFNFSPDLSKNLLVYLSLIEKPINLLFSLDQFLFEFSKKTYQQRKTGEFFQRLKERKKLSLFYGYLSQKKLEILFMEAAKKKGYFSKNIFSLLERRLDVVLYRSGFVKTITQARQLISHKKIQVNSQKVTFPSYCVNPGDIISLTANTSQKQQILDQRKKKRRFFKTYGDFFFKFKTNFGRKFKKSQISKIACNLFIQLLCTRIKLKSFLNLENRTVDLKKNNKILALLKWKNSAISLLSFKNENFRGKKQINQIVYANGGSLQKKPLIWSSKMTNLKRRRTHRKIRRDFNSFKIKKSSGNLNKKNQIISKNSFLMLSKHFNNSRKLSRLIRLNMKKYLIKRSFYSQKFRFKKILDFRLLKPMHLEISYNLLTIIYLYSPQRINFPFFIDLDLIKRSFR